MSTPTLDRLNLEEVLGISDWNPELTCEAHRIGVKRYPYTGPTLHTSEKCPNPATCVIICHTRKCGAVLSCAECYATFRKTAAAKEKAICASCRTLYDTATGIWSEPI